MTRSCVNAPYKPCNCEGLCPMLHRKTMPIPCPFQDWRPFIKAMRGMPMPSVLVQGFQLKAYAIKLDIELDHDSVQLIWAACLDHIEAIMNNAEANAQVLEQSETLDGRICQLIRLTDGIEYIRYISPEEALDYTRAEADNGDNPDEPH